MAAYDHARTVFIDPGLSYSTFLGGTGGDNGTAIAVDASGFAYVTGVTESADFPTTMGAYKTTPPGGGNMFVTKVEADGSGLVYSTYLGGDALDNFKSGRGIAVDSSG
ncbi:MAG TPA: SBBP repeat-containing protein, partial [Patescibacteria group bacterium]|nr:SBBP repeat-containing protein [Patescibacteria group bacterium]